MYLRGVAEKAIVPPIPELSAQNDSLNEQDERSNYYKNVQAPGNRYGQTPTRCPIFHTDERRFWASEAKSDKDSLEAQLQAKLELQRERDIRQKESESGIAY